MYIDRIRLRKNPSFRMEGGEFSTLLESMKKGKEHGEDVPVNIAVTVRTDSTNEVISTGESLLFTRPVVTDDFEGYMALMQTTKELLEGDLAKETFTADDIRKTVVMPVGAYIDNDELYFYFSLIVKPEIKDKLKYDFISINDLTLNSLDEKSIIVLPTLVLTNQK